MDKISNNEEFAVELKNKFGGKVYEEPHRSYVWEHENQYYLVRVGEENILPEQPTFPIHGMVFYLKKYNMWGIWDMSAFDMSSLTKKDANEGIWE